MKKVLFLMIAALSAGFASAVTMAWSNMGTSTTDGIITNMAVGNYTTFTFCLGNTENLTSTLPEGVSQVALKSIVLLQRVSNQTTTATSGSILVNGTTYTSNTMTTGTGIAYTPGNQYTRTSMTYTFDQEIILNVADPYTFTFSQSNGLSVVQPLNSSTGLTDTAWSPAITINVESLSVPEPTMLALIALGVAGLALKRRA